MVELKELLNDVSSLEQKLATLKHELRQQIVKEDVPEGELTLLLVTAADEQLAIGIQHVEEVLPMCRLSSCPESPPWISGLLNLRGDMLPVLDFTARTHKSQRATLPTDFIVVCQMQQIRFGLVVQKVSDIFRPISEDMDQVSTDMPMAPYMLGFFHVEDRVIYLLSLTCLVETSMLPEISL